MPGGFGTIDTPWGSAGTTSTPGPYSSPGGGNQGGPGHPGGYNPNLNPPVTVTSPVVDTSGNGHGNGLNTIDQVIGQEVIPPTQEELQLIQDDKVWAMAELEASNEKYAKSYEGKLMLDAGYKPGDKEWTSKFGLGSIVGTNTGEWKKNEQGEWKFINKEGIRSTTTGDYIYTGLGKKLLDQGNITGSEGYEKAKGEYWKTRTEQERFEDQQQNNYGYYGGDPGGGGGYPGGPGGWVDVKRFSRGRPENISPWARNIAGTPMLPVAGSGAGASMAAADELYALASGKKAFSMTPEEQGILALLNA